MSSRSGTIHVTAISGEVCRYQVESWQRQGLHHTVDLLEHGGNGECSCKDFATRCHTNLKENGGKHVPYGYPGHPDPDRTQCRHIHVARIKFANDTLKIMAKQHGQPQRT